MSAFSGGEGIEKKLHEIAKKLGKGDLLKVGLLEGATYPDGTPVALVAATQEFGGEIEVPEHEQDIYFKQNKNGTIGKKFVKKEKANFSQTVTVPAHKVVIPPRPFFRKMVWEKSKGWGALVNKSLRNTNYDVEKAMSAVGEEIRGQLQNSIRQLTAPPLAASTVRDKGFSKPLIDTGHMLNSVDYEVGDGS
ncbi:hypothetical protein [Klebsiella pneumoniae]|uniref:hypothetical protein n=1 Tax=Klebsiella pneumoniae TaxID=573 RepID=UPI001F4A84FD|nr:hypothetical protein [Klebsiella pneumoniae]HBW3346586.1 hypothetical protein [Klebsiella pneumoniae]